MVYLDNLEVDDFIGTMFFGVRQLKDSEMGMDVSNCTELPSWGNGTEGSEFTGNYTITMFSSGCYSISDGDTDWSTTGCRVGRATGVI